MEKLEKSLAEARNRISKLDRNHKNLLSKIRKIEAEIDACEDNVYIILNEMELQVLKLAYDDKNV
jgi:predicted  nucleic acid-binding Zn-ribbon protein